MLLFPVLMYEYGKRRSHCAQRSIVLLLLMLVREYACTLVYMNTPLIYIAAL